MKSLFDDPEALIQLFIRYCRGPELSEEQIRRIVENLFVERLERVLDGQTIT